MIKKFVFIILTSFFSLSAICQRVIVKITMDNKMADVKSDTIYYSENRPLTWEDFKGAPQINSIAGAVTSSGFAFNATMNMVADEVYLYVNVYTYFSKKNSWRKPGIGTAYHLMHEQHHFDITRLSAQKFFNELLKANFTYNNYNPLITAIFNKSFEENNLLQQKYDTETRNSMDNAAQLQWNDKISNWVKVLY